MHKVMFAAAVVVLFAVPAVAADDLMANTYGNTLVSVSGGGMESHTYYNEDHTFSGKVPAMGFEYKGTWMIDDKGQLCRNFDPPVPGRTNPDCGAFENHAVGDKWNSTDGGTVRLNAGVN